MRFVVPANLLGLPAISVPVSVSVINHSRVLCYYLLSPEYFESDNHNNCLQADSFKLTKKIFLSKSIYSAQEMSN